MKKFFQEFKKFVAKGNIFDMAVGLILASAFNKIVSSLVNDILMPLFTFAIGAESLADLTFVFHGKNSTFIWHYGLFLQAILNFFIIALSLFILVKIVANSQKKMKEFNAKLLALTKKEQRKQIKALKKQAKQENKPFKVLLQEYNRKKVLQKEQQNIHLQLEIERLKADFERKENASTNQKDPQVLQLELLQEICNILKTQRGESATIERKEPPNSI